MATLDRPYTWDGEYMITPLEDPDSHPFIDPENHPTTRLDTTGDLVSVIAMMTQEQRARNYEHATENNLTEVLQAHEDLIEMLMKQMGFD